MAITLKNLPDQEFVAPGRAGCPGCSAVIAARMVSKVAGNRSIMVTSTGCMCVNYGYYAAPGFPFFHTLFENAGSVISGIDAGLKALGQREGINLFGFCGDGGTVDIGLQALSGAVERGHRFLYICYDNEGYMNTGVQRSGATPYGARTATTPVGQFGRGEPRPLARRKDMVRVMAAHGIPYTANACIGYPLDFLRKVEKALKTDGPSYIHVLSPCVPGWGYPEEITVSLAKLAVETGFFPLYEVEDGVRFNITVKTGKRKPVVEYLKLQHRFDHLFEENNAGELERIQQDIDANHEYLKRLCG